MEQLPAAERARISKMSTEYLISKLAKETDRPVSELSLLGRQALLEDMAKLVLSSQPAEGTEESTLEEGEGNPQIHDLPAQGAEGQHHRSQSSSDEDEFKPVTSPTFSKFPLVGDSALQREIFEWQKQCWEREFEEKRQEKVTRAERELTRAERELEVREQLEQKRMANELELGLRRVELESQRNHATRQESEGLDRVRSRAAQAKLFGDAMRSAAVKLSTDPLELLPFFENVERVFRTLEVPDYLRADLIRPYLNERAVKLLSQLDATQQSDYKSVKDYLIQQFRLSPRFFLDKFNGITRQHDETARSFISRLKTLLSYYLKSRNVRSFDQLVSLLVSDRYKSILTDDCLNHVLSIEATKDVGWLDCDALADVVDNYYANRIKGRPAAASVGQKPLYRSTLNSNSNRSVNNRGVEQGRNVNVAQAQHSGSTTVKKTIGENKPSGIVCWHCNGVGHTKAGCPLLANGNRSSRQASGRPGGGRVVQANEVVTAVVVEAESAATSSEHTVSEAPAVVRCDRCIVDPDLGDVSCGGDGDVADRNFAVNNSQRCGNDSAMAWGKVERSLPVSDLSVEGRSLQCVGLAESVNDIAELSYCNIIINETGHTVRCLNDSGCQIVIVNKRILNNFDYQVCGQINVRGVVGDAVKCDLSYLHLSLPDCDNQCTVRTICAISDEIHEDLIVPSVVITRLNDMYNQYLLSVNNNSNVSETEQVLLAANVTQQDKQLSPSSADSTNSDGGNDDTDDNCLNVDDVKSVCSDGELSVRELQQEQLNDSSLTGCFAFAKQQKGKYFVKDNILFRIERVCNQDVECILVPSTRRKHVLDLAHSVTGGHFNFRKTCDRIRISGMTWETVLRDCKEWVKCCRICQQMSPQKCWDRIPIQAIPRATSLFSHFFCDVFGPVFPGQNVRYNYCIVLVDSYSLWVSAYPLRSITAKSICTALLNMFSITGLSTDVTILATDNASYYKCELTRELLKCIGVSPRFHTPHYSASTGLVERHLQTVKRVLAKLAEDHPRQWWEYLPYTLWAMRESVSNPLQVQPFMMVTGGRQMRGPLSILHDSWLGFRNLPVSLGKRTEDFLQEVKAGLEAAEDYAKQQTELAQRQYVHYHNLRARPKKFSVGQECLILQPDSTSSRMFSRWKGPAKIIEVKFPDSYIVDYDGRKYHLHANHLRPYYVYADTVTCSISELCNLMLIDDFSGQNDSGNVALGLDSSCDDVTCVEQCCNTCSIVYEKDTDFGDLHLLETTGSGEPAASCSSRALPSQSIDLNTLSHLSSAQRLELLTLLDRFHVIFSATPGLCSSVIHEIPTTPDFVPKRIKGYRIPETLRPEVEKQIAELLRMGFIRESNSPMSSPIVTVIKPSGGVRVCVNYQYLNKYTVPDQITLPDISTIIHRIGNARYISKFDAPSGYHQCMIAEKDRWKTAFVCGSNLYEWIRCPFGLRSSGCTFVVWCPYPSDHRSQSPHISVRHSAQELEIDALAPSHTGVQHPPF